MKTFNKSISIEISIDVIANMLLDNMNKEFKHSELVVEMLIGRALAKDDNRGISLLYNALNGHKNEINFQVGNIVKCSIGIGGYWEGAEGSHSYNSDVLCTVIKVDVCSDNQLTLEYEIAGKQKTISTNIAYCTKMPEQFNPAEPAEPCYE